MSTQQPFEERHPHLAEFSLVLKVSNSESDRGAVLVYAAMMDDLLRRSIEARLIDHKDVKRLTDGFNAPVGTFASRNLLALGLGVVSEREYQEVELIRKIRNAFAHSIDMSFDAQAIAARCAKLSFAILESDGVQTSSRVRFLTAASCLHLNLVNRAHYVKERRLGHEEWRY
jgi:mannitol operon repressor